MKKLFNISAILFMLLLTFISPSKAQQASGMPHSFAVSAAAIPAFPAGPTNIALGAGADESVSFVSPAAGSWSFTFAGQVYTKFVASSNGWIALMPNAIAATPASVTPLPANQLNNNTTGYPIVAPLWDDLSTAVISWVVPAASNTLWVRWATKWDKNNPATSASLVYIKLDGTNNSITFYYANLPAYTPTNASASIGIAGMCAGDYYSVFSTASNAAYVDSVTENTMIGNSGLAPEIRPYNTTYIFSPYSINDNCSGSYPARNLALNASCTNIVASTFNAAASGSGNCGTGDDNDVWFRVIKPANVTNLTITTSAASCQSVSGTSMEVYASCGGAMVGCAITSTANPNYAQVGLSRSCAAETLFVRVTADGDVAGKFQICATIGGGSAGATCANATFICSLPYSLTGASTAGSGNDYDSTTAACHSIFMNGEDYIFSYQPAANQCIRISLTSSGNNPGVFIYSGCPNSGGVYCLGSAEGATGNIVINSASLIGGQTYYIVVDNSVSSGNNNIPFDISVTAVGTANAYDNCATPVNLGTISNSVSCIPQTFSTECSTPTAAGVAGVPSCVPANNPPYFIDGVTGDVWLRFTVSYSGSLQINTFQSASNPTANAAMAVYQGASCPSGGAAPYACDYNSGPNGMPTLSIPVVNGQTYYIRIWTENPENTGNFDICFQSACSPPNDLPCAAVFVPLGGTATGFNTCASGTGEPPNAAQCPAGGTVNTVWYKAVVPPSGSIRVRTHPLTLTDTQIQGFSFATTCASAFTARTCNDDGAACSGGFNDFSEQLFSGLTPGDSLFIAVDGNGSLTGSFEISFIDGNSTVFPPVLQQDCGAPQIICSTSNIVVADPGFRNYGNQCDLPAGYGCWGTGERNSVWYQFTVDPSLSGGTATVSFSINTLASVDIDFIMWDITGISNPCAGIQSLTLAQAGCNYAASSSSTGLTTTSPLPYAYSNAVTFSGAPRTYLLLLNNWNSSNNAGFTLDWGTTPISTTPTNATWSGVTDTLFTTATNWGSCGTTPACGVDATVNSTANGRQPTVTAGLPAKSVRNITINAGATLRIKAGATLSVCGNFTNLGTLICEAGSTIQFVGNSLQIISGVLTGANSFANLVINKPGGSVQLQSNIDVKENFTTSNGTSIFDMNARYMKVAGHFTNFNGTTTFTNIGGSTVEFNGTTDQSFVNTNGIINLNRVTMNKPTGKLFLQGANSRMNIDSILTLTSGIIVTRSLPALEVNMKYFQPAAIVGNNASSYIKGKLRRKIANPVGPASPTIPASYEFPLGEDSLTPGPGGYENAVITFTSSTLVFDLLGTFNVWPSGAPNPGPVASECVVATYSNRPIFNNGYWTFTRSTSTFGGNYDISLRNTGFTNNTGLGWTVAKADLAANVSLASSWRLQGTCVFPGSTPANAQRSNMNTPARDSTSFNHNYATVQTDLILPIELLYFTAEAKSEKVICKWETASETNNEYFNVERSLDGKIFKSIGFVRGYGAGISSESREYSFVDDESCFGIRYYRLKQVDIDGAFSHSDIVAVNCSRSQGVELYPNPANTSITYQFHSDTDTEMNVYITDLAGRVVFVEKVNALKGINVFTNNIETLAAGAYYLRISNSDNESARIQTQFFKN